MPGKQKQAKHQQRGDAHANGGAQVPAPPVAVARETAPVFADVVSVNAVQSIFARPADLFISGIYVACFAAAAMQLFAGCRGQGAKFGKFFDPVCQPLQSVDQKTVLGLHKQWYKEVQTAKPEEHDFWLLVNLLVNLPLAPVLALVMIFGARKNAYQNLAIFHATALLLLTSHAAFTAYLAQPKQTAVFEAAYPFAVVASLLLLNRWWGDNVFAARDRVSSFGGGLFGLVRLCVNLLIIFAAANAAVTVYDWAVSSHSDLKGYARLRPTLTAYAKVAQEQAAAGTGELSVHLKAGWGVVSEQLAAVGKIVMAKIEEFQKAK